MSKFEFRGGDVVDDPDGGRHTLIDNDIEIGCIAYYRADWDDHSFHSLRKCTLVTRPFQVGDCVVDRNLKGDCIVLGIGMGGDVLELHCNIDNVDFMANTKNCNHKLESWRGTTP